jgi:hypothetical protein
MSKIIGKSKKATPAMGSVQELPKAEPRPTTPPPVKKDHGELPSDKKWRGMKIGAKGYLRRKMNREERR